MPLSITSEKYNGLQGLYANAGDWVNGETTFRNRFSIGSGVSNKFTYNNTAGDFSITLQNGTASEWGFIAGNTLIIEYTLYLSGVPFVVLFTTTVLYTTGSTVFFADELKYTYLGTVYPFSNGQQFPQDNYVSGILAYVDKAPDSVSFQFNLTPNGSNMLDSLIDGELSRFEYEYASSLTIGSTVPMVQLISKSGSLIARAELTYVSSEAQGWKQYKIQWKFLQWGIIKDGFTEPNYYNNADCVAPIFKISAFAQYGNPNGISEGTSDNTESNTGGYNENLNGGVSLYNSTGITWEDNLGNAIQGLNNSGVSKFTATVEAPNQNNSTSRYRIGLIWRPIDGSYYQNKALTNLGENLLAIVPENDFIANGVSSGAFLGMEDSNGARWDISDVKFSLSGTVLTVEGTITPNSLATTLFAGVPNGGRLSTLWISLGDVLTDGTINSKRVSLQLFNDDNIDAPILGVQIPNVVSERLLDHAGVIIDTPKPQTTTEDDVLYQSDFLLLDNVAYEGVRTRMFAFNTVTEEEFTLEDNFFSFANVQNINGQFQPNFVINRGFNLPPTSDRNIIQLVRKTNIDVAGKYGIRLNYGYLARWQYWLEQSNVNNDFFSTSEFAFDGFNKNWQRFSNSGDWIIRIAYYTRLNGVDDFNYEEIGIRPYEDDVNVTTNWGIEVLSNGTFPTNFVDNELHELTATLTWSTGIFTHPWAEITIEDYEAGNRWVISSVLAQGGISNNPLKPISGQSKLNLQSSVNVAVLKTLVDTSLIASNKICVSARIYSKDVPIPAWEWLLQDNEGLVAYSDARLLRQNYAGALIRVRRSIDDAELDIYSILVGIEYVLDEETLRNFAVEGDAFIVIRYNQANDINDNNAIQTFHINQPPIVIGGVVLKDTVSNRPAHLCDGINHFHPIVNGGVESKLNLLSVSVFADTVTMGATTRNRIGIGNDDTKQEYNVHNMLWQVNPTDNRFFSKYTEDSLTHFIDRKLNGGFIALTWGNNIGLSEEIFQRMNGVNGTDETANFVDANYLDKVDRFKLYFHTGFKSEDVIFGGNRVNSPTWIEDNCNTFYQMF